MAHRYGCLLGNGFALEYNLNLSVQRLTSDLESKFNGLGAQAGALQSVPQFASRPGQSFEEMLGPIESAGEVVRELRKLTALSSNSSLKREITSTSDFADQIHRIGMGTVLELIASRSVGVGSGAIQPLNMFISALTNLVTGRLEDLSIATLNYDGLTLSGLLDGPAGICDLAAGYGSKRKILIPGSKAVSGHPIRTEDDFQPGTTVTFQLHGSLGWLRSPVRGEVWKFSIDDLRSIGYWKALEQNTTRWRPVVVLTDRKDRTIEKDPFRLAYDLFEKRLRTSDRWLVAGYGRADTPVNELLRRAWRARSKIGLAKATQVLVVDHPSCPLTVAQIQGDVASKTGIPSSQISVALTGIARATQSAEWSAWV
jgi:hypothetical protein